MKKILAFLMLTAFVAAWAGADTQTATARKQPGAEVELYAPEQHDLYDGRFVLTAGRLHQVGRLEDPPVPEGDLVLEFDRFHEFSPCQDGGVAAFIYEHGDSGCGDANWPKTFIYVAGWGYGHATLNGERLYQDYQMHFMVTQGIRDRQTLEVKYPLLNKKSPAGAVNPAAQQIDFYIRSPEMDARNNPTRKVFDHFFALEVTWK